MACTVRLARLISPGLHIKALFFVATNSRVALIWFYVDKFMHIINNALCMCIWSEISAVSIFEIRFRE